MSDSSGDFRFAVRMLRRNPGFTVMAVAALALGIGANTAIFSVANKVLLEPLPYPEPDRLVQLMSTSGVGDQVVVSIAKYVTWRDHTTNVFESIAAYDVGGPAVNLTERDIPEALRGARVSADYFRLFGARIEAGRTFSGAEDQPGGKRVALVSHNLWKHRFRGDPALIGRAIPLDYEDYQVIGVVAADFPMEPAADVWLPLQADMAAPDHAGRVRVAARMRPGFTLKDADRAVWKTMSFYSYRFGNLLLFHETFTAIPLRDGVVGNVRDALYLLLGAVGFVLLISCANVANLLLARSTRRVREIAIRTALGAGRREIIRQLLTESVVLSLSGGVVGLAIGYLGVRELLAVSPADIPRIGANGSAITMDWRIFVFTFLVSVFTGILFGLLPALTASRADVGSLVKTSVSQSGMGFRRNRGRAILVIAEMALALVLLAGAGLLIRTFVATRTLNRGFDEQNVLTLEMSLASPHFDTTSQVTQLMSNAETRLKRIGSISAVATTDALPLEPSLTMPFTIHGRDQTLVGTYHGVASWRSVSPDYFDAFRIRLLRGRLFTQSDGSEGAPVMLINRAMYRKYWQEVDANPIGDYVLIGKDMGKAFVEGPRQIVGVVADVRDAGLNREPAMYLPAAQVTDLMTARNHHLLPLTWVVRTTGPMPAPVAAIERELREASGGLPLERVRTMHEVVAASSARTAFYTMMLSVFAGIALLMAAVGLYGVMAYSVEQRTQEIGIRMALGAPPESVRNLVVLQGMRLATLGIAAGIPMGLALTRAMDSMIFGIQTWDPMVFGTVAILLSAVALLATYVPSLGATRVNPVDALR